MSGRVFQGVIVQIKEATERTVGVIDEESYVIACSELPLIGTKLEDLKFSKSNPADGVIRTDSNTYRFLRKEGNEADFAVFVSGADEIACSICIMAAVSMSEAKAGYEEKHSKASFVKNIISDNILPGDVYIRAKELGFNSDSPRAVLLVRQEGEANKSAVEHIQALITDSQRDFVISMNERDTVVVKELINDENMHKLYSLAAEIEANLREKYSISTIIGISGIANHLRELADRYKQSQMAIDVGRIFETDSKIIKYDNLGIGRLIYQLPVTMCEMFLAEVFKKKQIDSLDSDTIHTINKFFENNLNVSETSRKLYVHRNTLVYRLEKIMKLTGLDLRKFDHAIVFKVAMLVHQYLESQRKDD